MSVSISVPSIVSSLLLGTTTAPTSTTTTTTSSSTTTPSSTSSSSTTSSTTTTTTTPTTTPTSTTSSSTASSVLASSTSIYVQTSNGVTITLTTVVPATQSVSSTSSTSSQSFFHNTAAVAGTFAGVGVVVLVLLIWSTLACVRRRRAKKFDDDIAAVAAAAAAAAHSPVFDDYDYPSLDRPGGVGAASSGMYSYSDVRNSPVTQPLLSDEAYGMSEMNGNSYHIHPVSVTPGAAGIGAGAAFRANSNGDPYAAFSTPQARRYGSPPPQEQQAWDETAAPVSSGHGLVQALAQQQNEPSLARNRSQGTTTLSSQTTTSDTYFNQQPMAPESYADHYRHGVDPVAEFDPYAITPTRTTPAADHELLNPFGSASGIVRPNSGGTVDDKNSYDDPQRASLGYSQADDDRMSLRDEEDYGAGKRVLKVANA